MIRREEIKERLRRAGGFGTLFAIMLMTSVMTTTWKYITTPARMKVERPVITPLREVPPPAAAPAPSASRPVPEPPEGFVLDRFQSEYDAVDLEDQAAKAERDARSLAAIEACSILKRERKHYYSVDAPDLECRAEASEKGEPEFEEQYLK